MAPRRRRTPRLLLAAAAVAALWPQEARGQIRFSAMDGPEYITYCAEVASTQILTPPCADAYGTLQGLMMQVLSSPANFTHRQLGALNGLCSTDAGTSCVAQMQNLGEMYLDGLPPPPPAISGRDTCEGTLAPNAKALFGTALPFVCLSDGHGGSCLVKVATVLQESGARPAAAQARNGYARAPPLG